MRAWNRNRAGRYLALTVIGVLVLAGCGVSPTAQSKRGSNSSTSGEAAPVGTGLFSTNSTTYAVFFQSNEKNGIISGTIQSELVSGSPPTEKAESVNEPVTGRVTHNQVVLNIEGAKAYGTYSGRDLKLNLPTADGTLREETLRPASPEAFNRAVRKLHDRVRRDNQADSNGTMSMNAWGQEASPVITRLGSDMSKLAQDASSQQFSTMRALTGKLQRDIKAAEHLPEPPQQIRGDWTRLLLDLRSDTTELAAATKSQNITQLAQALESFANVATDFDQLSHRIEQDK